MALQFSILMANYNKGEYIAEAIDSVINQTANNWELIIFDDFSNDSSREIIKNYSTDSRIRIIYSPRNVGKIQALREMIGKANGDIIAILDSDDVLMPDAIKEVTKVFEEKHDIGLVYTQFIFCDENLNQTKRGYSKKIPKNGSNLLKPATVALRAFRKNLYYQTSGYDDDVIYSEDVDMIFKLEELTKFYFLDQPLYLYRRVPDSHTTEKTKREIGRASCALAKYKAYKRRLGTDLPNLKALEISCQMYYACLILLKIRDWPRIKRFCKIAFWLYPLNYKATIVIFARIVKYPFYNLFRSLKKNKFI